MNFKVCSNLDTWGRSRDTLRMSALGQKQTLQHILLMSGLPPKSGHRNSTVRCLLCAKSGHCDLFDHLVGTSE